MHVSKNITIIASCIIVGSLIVSYILTGVTDKEEPQTDQELLYQIGSLWFAIAFITGVPYALYHVYRYEQKIRKSNRINYK